MIATTNTAPVAPARASSRLASSALAIGGALMIVMYAFQIVHGINTGETMAPANMMNRPLLHLSGISFSAGMLGIALGLAGIGLGLRSRSPKLATLAIALPLLAALAPAYNLVANLAGFSGMPSINGFTVLANLASATMLGVAALRTKALPRGIALTLLAVGLVTFPLILLTIPAEAVLPPYVAMDLPFPVWGAIFAGIGVALGRARGAE